MRRPSAEELVAIDDAHAVTFTSSSTVRAFVAAAGRHRVPPLVAVIGPATARTARELGLDVHVEAEPHTVEGLVDALVSFVARHGMPQGRDR
jgi:uroporphyrinogen III methyltransferase/synthase